MSLCGTKCSDTNTRLQARPAFILFQRPARAGWALHSRTAARAGWAPHPRAAAREAIPGLGPEAPGLRGPLRSHGTPSRAKNSALPLPPRVRSAIASPPAPGAPPVAAWSQGPHPGSPLRRHPGDARTAARGHRTVPWPTWRPGCLGGSMRPRTKSRADMFKQTIVH